MACFTQNDSNINWKLNTVYPVVYFQLRILLFKHFPVFIRFNLMFRSYNNNGHDDHDVAQDDALRKNNLTLRLLSLSRP